MSNCIIVREDIAVPVEVFDCEGFERFMSTVTDEHRDTSGSREYIAAWFLKDSWYYHSHNGVRYICFMSQPNHSKHTWRDWDAKLKILTSFLKTIPGNIKVTMCDESDGFSEWYPAVFKWADYKSK